MKAPVDVSELRRFFHIANQMGSDQQACKGLVDQRKCLDLAWPSTKSFWRNQEANLGFSPSNLWSTVRDNSLSRCIIWNSSCVDPEATIRGLEICCLHIKSPDKQRERGSSHDMGMQENVRLSSQKDIPYRNGPQASCSVAGPKEPWWNATKDPETPNAAYAIELHNFLHSV